MWRDFGINVARSAANRPWMPALGNHETSSAPATTLATPVPAPGGIAAQGAAGNYWNGPYGYGHYLSRFLLPDNGVTNWDGNHLRGNFYSFQVGTVLFISLDADDVIYQDGASDLSASPNAAPETTSSGAQIPNGTVTYNHGYTGDLGLSGRTTRRCLTRARAAQPADGVAGADAGRRPPGPGGRHDRRVHAPVRAVHLAHPATAPTSASAGPGCRCSTTTRWTWCSAGHDHDYERTYPGPRLRTGKHGTVVCPPPARPRRATRSTPAVPRCAATSRRRSTGRPAWNTGQGTVYLVLGGGGTNGPANVYGQDAKAACRSPR